MAQETDQPRSAAGQPRFRTLRSADEFKSVYRRGHSYHGRGFALRVARRESSHPTTDPVAFGFVVSTKVSKSAVIRNRVRRRAREFARRHAAEIAPGRAVVVAAKQPAPGLSPAETVRELSSLFKQATLIR